MATNTERWVQRLLYGGTKQDLSRENVFSMGDRLFSYGQHFELARLLRDRKGEHTGFLLNGDTYSNTTSRHQRGVRWAVERTGLPSVIIPHSALAAAGVDPATVQIVHVLPDRNEEKHHTVYEQPEHTKWVTYERREWVDLTPEELAALVEVRQREANERWAFNREHYGPTTVEPQRITVESLWSHEKRKEVVTGVRTVQLEWLRGHRESWGYIDVTALPDGTCKYEWTTYRHWLGESLIRAKVTVQRTERCKACKATGRADGISQDYRRFVHASYEAYCEGECTECRGLGNWTRRVSRWAFFLSGFDHNESRPVYFFCELPRGAKPTTVEEAYEALKPDTVKLAEQMGRTVHRQGDIFAVELVGITKRELRAKGARFERSGRLFSTNHEATEVAYLPDGTTLVRGTLWHRPAGRRPDHRRVTVGKSWHIAIKNTVPLSK